MLPISCQKGGERGRRTIRNQPKAVRPDTIQHLDDHKPHIQDQEIEYLP